MKPDWKAITLKIDYGYGGSYPAVDITCYPDGQLFFQNRMDGSGLPPHCIVRASHKIDGQALQILNALITEILAVKRVENESEVYDAGSFECKVRLVNNKLVGYGYYAWPMGPRLKELERELRELLGEEYFLKKYEKEIGDLS